MKKQTMKNCELIHHLWKENPKIRIYYFCRGEDVKNITAYILSLEAGSSSNASQIRDASKRLEKLSLFMDISEITMMGMFDNLQKCAPINIIIFNDKKAFQQKEQE